MVGTFSPVHMKILCKERGLPLFTKWLFCRMFVCPTYLGFRTHLKKNRNAKNDVSMSHETKSTAYDCVGCESSHAVCDIVEIAVLHNVIERPWANFICRLVIIVLLLGYVLFASYLRIILMQGNDIEMNPGPSVLSDVTMGPL